MEPKIQKKPSDLKRELPALQSSKHEISNFFLLLWVILAFLDPDPDSGHGSIDLIKSRSDPDPDPIRVRNTALL
jgi:hypothetical protein